MANKEDRTHLCVDSPEQHFRATEAFGTNSEHVPVCTTMTEITPCEEYRHDSASSQEKSTNSRSHHKLVTLLQTRHSDLVRHVSLFFRDPWLKNPAGKVGNDRLHVVLRDANIGVV